MSFSKENNVQVFFSDIHHVIYIYIYMYMIIHDYLYLMCVMQKKIYTETLFESVTAWRLGVRQPKCSRNWEWHKQETFPSNET